MEQNVAASKVLCATNFAAKAANKRRRQHSSQSLSASRSILPPWLVSSACLPAVPPCKWQEEVLFRL
jgi:hypothetical protein